MNSHSASLAILAWGDEQIVPITDCCILPDQVHAVIDRHDRLVEQIVGHLKSAATRQSRADGLRPFANEIDGTRSRSVWGYGWSKVYSDSRSDVERSIRYVEQNPLKEGKRVQRRSFVER